MDYRPRHQKDLLIERLKVKSQICTDYQQRLIMEISNLNINLHNRPAHIIIITDKIWSCLQEVKKKIEEFVKGYWINCDYEQRSRFVKKNEIYYRKK